MLDDGLLHFTHTCNIAKAALSMCFKYLVNVERGRVPPCNTCVVVYSPPSSASCCPSCTRRFPRPVHHRIPNFAGAQDAAQKLARLPEFQQAKCVKVNPDTPQKEVSAAEWLCRRLSFFPSISPQSFLQSELVVPITHIVISRSPGPFL